MANNNKPDAPQTLGQKLADTLGEDVRELSKFNELMIPIADIIERIEKSDDKRAKHLKSIGDTLVKVAKLEHDIAKSTFRSTDLTDDMVDAKRKGNVEDLRRLQLADQYQNKLKRENDLINHQVKLIRSIGDQIDNLLAKVPGGGIIGSLLGISGMGDELEKSFRVMMTKAGSPRQSRFRRGMMEEATGGMITEFTRKFGQGIEGPEWRSLTEAGVKKQTIRASTDIAAAHGIDLRETTGETLTMGKIARNMGKHIGKLAVGGIVAGSLFALSASVRAGRQKGMGFGGTGRGWFQQLFFGSTADAFESEFGKVNELSTKTAGEFRWMAFYAGLSAENAAKLSKELELNTDLTKEQSVDMLKTVQGLAKAAGVAPKAIFEDLAQNAEMFAQFSKDGAIGLAEAAIKAKTLGLNLQAVGSISKSLLDFETSISNEFEAQVLTGKMLNLDTARRLALAGKSTEMLDEIVRQVGGERELRSMNILALQSLATAVGLSAGELQRVAQGNEISAKNPVVSKLDETNEILRAQLDDAQRANLKNLQNQQLFMY